MARRLAWSNVRGGVIALAVIVGICAATLKYARVGALRGARIHLYVVVGAARGLLKGSEVWLMGQKVGKISDIRFRAPSESDTATRVLVEMEVLEKYRDAMHRDAVAQIRPGGSLIGAMVVYLYPGSASTPAIRDGDTVHARPQADVESAAAQFGAAAKELPAILGNVKSIRSELQSTGGSVGALMQSAQSERGALQSASAQLSRLRRRLNDGQGSLDRIMAGAHARGLVEHLLRSLQTRQHTHCPGGGHPQGARERARSAGGFARHGGSCGARQRGVQRTR
jgi:ABC-type transporter Mla subunit MlaD